MPIPFSCESCGRSLNVRDELAGQQIYCPECKSILTVPLEAPPPEPEPDVPMAEVAPPAEQDSLSVRAEEPPPMKPEVHEIERWDEDEEPVPRVSTAAPTAASGPNIGAILGGIGLMTAGVVLVFIGLFTGFWIIKGIVILFIAGIVTFFKGLFGKTD